jgi:hypothetical protein
MDMDHIDSTTEQQDDTPVVQLQLQNTILVLGSQPVRVDINKNIVEKEQTNNNTTAVIKLLCRVIALLHYVPLLKRTRNVSTAKSSSILQGGTKKVS